VIEAFEKEQADYLVFLGDVMYHGPRNPLPAEYDRAGVAKVLNTLRNKVIAVGGNCDSEVDQMLLDFPITADYQTIPSYVNPYVKGVT
jgi:predicted phosphodiesterase